MAIETVGRAEAGAPGASPIAAPALPPRRDFAAVLDAHLAEPRSQLSDLRAQLDAIRSGRLGAAAEGAAARTTDYSQLVKQWAARGAGAADPHGWRSATRAIGEQSVGPGFGALFERQIAQESGFDPAVVLGQRRSSAGAEGIAQLMPQYYPGVDRTDPVASLQAGAATMRHNLVAFDGDVRKALAAYNAGLGRVQQLVQAHGIEWERALPAETKQYLAAIVGDAKTTFRPVGEAAVYGGRGTSGVLTSPLARVLGRQYGGALGGTPGAALGLLGMPGAPVLAPADGIVRSMPGGTGIGSAGGSMLGLDGGNGWGTTLDGLDALRVGAGDVVRRGQPLGTLGSSGVNEVGAALLNLGVSLHGRALDPRLYLP